MTQWQPYLIAFMVGLLVGIEREKSQPNPKAMGIRTFLLVSLLGAIAADLQNPWLAALLTSFALGLILISYFTQTHSKSSDADRGLTTEFAAGIVYCLGYVAHQSPALVAVLGPIVAVILFSKASLHRFTHAIKPAELQAAILLFLVGVVIVNLVPDSLIDPWEIFNPRKFGYLILTLAVLEFSSYILVKIIGEKKGSLIVGFLGGFISSTAVLLSSARQATRSPSLWQVPLRTALAAKLAAIIELLLIVGLISPTLLMGVLMPVGAALFVGVVALIILGRKKEDSNSELNIKPPLDWKGIFRLSIMLGCILALISLAKLWLGESATLAVSFLTALFELHGVSLANPTMYSHGQLSDHTAIQNILLAVIASLVAKITISWIIIRRGGFSRALTAIFLPMAGMVLLGIWFTQA